MADVWKGEHDWGWRGNRNCVTLSPTFVRHSVIINSNYMDWSFGEERKTDGPWESLTFSVKASFPVPNNFLFINLLAGKNNKELVIKWKKKGTSNSPPVNEKDLIVLLCTSVLFRKGAEAYWIYFLSVYVCASVCVCVRVCMCSEKIFMEARRNVAANDGTQKRNRRSLETKGRNPFLGRSFMLESDHEGL